MSSRCGLKDNELTIRLVHCKYAYGDKPGHRLEDLYQVWPGPEIGHLA
jgi:hypothetical protein